MSRRERIMLIVTAILAVAAIFYYYVYSPRQAEYTRLVAERDDREAQLDRMKTTAQQRAQLERRYQDLLSFIQTVEAKLPKEKEVPALLVQLERLTKSLGINLQAIKPSALQAVSPAPAATPAAGAPTGPPAPVNPQVPTGTSGYFRFPITLTMTTSYGELLRLANSLQNFPRLLVVRKLTIAPRNVPDLTAGLEIETFVLPKEAR